jgi:hypothetical protein
LRPSMAWVTPPVSFQSWNSTYDTVPHSPQSLTTTLIISDKWNHTVFAFVSGCVTEKNILKAHPCYSMYQNFLSYKRLFRVVSIKFTAKLNGRHRNFPYTYILVASEFW